MVSPARALATAAEIVPVPGRTVIVWCGTACAGRALAAQVVRAAPRIATSVARSFRRAVRCLIVDLNMDVSLSVPTTGCRRPEIDWSVAVAWPDGAGSLGAVRPDPLRFVGQCSGQ